jgi:hypothetical protein
MYIACNHRNTNCILFPCVSSVYSILLSTDFTYSHVPGDQGGPIFFRLQDFRGWSFYILFGIGYKFVSEHVQICVKLYVTNLNVSNLY